MVAFPRVADEAHALFPPGDEQVLEPKRPAQLQSPLLNLPLAGTGPHHGLELGQVGRYQGGTGIAAEIAALGVHQHRGAGGTGPLDPGQRVGQGPLAVVREHHQPVCRQLCLELLQQAFLVVIGKAVLEVEPDELLVAADDAQLGDGGKTGVAVEMALDPGLGESLAQLLRHGILAGDAHQSHPATERTQVVRHVARATGASLLATHVHHGNRRLGRDPLGGTMPVAVEHQVARHQHPRRREVWKSAHLRSRPPSAPAPRTGCRFRRGRCSHRPSAPGACRWATAARAGWRTG